jgi:hypothetical protein
MERRGRSSFFFLRSCERIATSGSKWAGGLVSWAMRKMRRRGLILACPAYLGVFLGNSYLISIGSAVGPSPFNRYVETGYDEDDTPTIGDDQEEA